MAVSIQSEQLRQSRQRARRPRSADTLRAMEQRAGQEGYVLVGVLFLVFLVMVALSIAAPRMAKSIERDREVEMQHRAKQYVRAIKLYYKKFGAYPPTIEALQKQNEIRFLRKRYKDPITGKDDWKLIHFGQNKMPTVYGFFGQPMVGSSIAGTGPGAAGSLLGNSGTGVGSTGIGSTGFGSSGFGSSGFGSTGTSTTSGSTDSSANGTSSGTSGSSNGGTNSTSGSDSSSGSNSSSGFGSSNNGQTFGGGGIIGVESTSAKLAILQYRKKTHFNEWEFVYDPMADQIMLSNNTNIGSPASGLSTSGVATPGTFSNQQNNTGVPQPQQQQQQPQQQQTTTTPQ